MAAESADLHEDGVAERRTVEVSERLVEGSVRIAAVVVDMKHNRDWPIPVEAAADHALRRTAADYRTYFEMDSSSLNMCDIYLAGS